MRVILGNPAPHEGVRHPETDELTFRPLGAPSVTTVELGGHSALDAARIITAAGGVWEHHGSEPPSWVSSDDPLTAELLAQHYGCPVGEPTADPTAVDGTLTAPTAPTAEEA